MFDWMKQELKQGKTLLEFGFLKAVGQALGMIAPLAVAKFFSEELFGSYALAKMIVFFFLTLLISSSQAPFIVLANQERKQTGKINKTFSVQLLFVLVSIFAFLLISMAFHKVITAFAQISFVDLVFMFLAFVGLALKSFVCNVFLAMGQRIKDSLAELVFGALTLALVFVFYWRGVINLRMVFLVYFISAVFVVFVFIKVIDFRQLRPFSIDKQHFKDMLNFTKWLMFGATAAYFVNWGDNLVLRFYVSMEDIGSYNLGYQVFKGMSMLTLILYSYFLPFVSQHIEDSGKMRSYLYNKRPKIFLPVIVIIGLIFAVFPYIFRFVYGDVYQDSIAVLRILLIGSVIVLYNVFYAPLLNALKKYKFTQGANIFQVLLNLLLDVLLVPVMGMLGAAVATVIAYFSKGVILEVYFRVRLRKLLQI